jgi:suppressor of G2 allele of SKP1
LERGEEQVAPRPNAYSSAAAGDTTRWDSLEDEPAGDINSVLQSIFSQGDESVRRAMLKSYQTSGGTVLSTNWNEVKDADYSNKPDTN